MIKDWLLRTLPRHRDSRLLRRIDRWCTVYHEAFENRNYDFHANGENFVLETLARQRDVRTILDVGANVGDWAAMAATQLPGARVHSFEIVPATRALLAQRVASLPNVQVHACGLGAAVGEVEVHVTEGMNANSTCVGGVTELFHKTRPATVTAPVDTGDRFLAAQGITHVDFLKLDVEGYEPQVLAGFAEALAAGRIRMIQFEYGWVNAMVRFLLKDFYDLLQPKGMRIGKIFPGHVEFRDYSLYEENFFGPNYLAVHESMDEWIRALQGPR